MEKQKIAAKKDEAQEKPQMEKLDLEAVEDVAGGLSYTKSGSPTVHTKSPMPF